MWYYLVLGLGMGLSAGLSPGPLLTLVVAASLRSGFAGGLRVALAPLLTDLPIILVSILVFARLPSEAMRWVGTVGGLVVIWLGVEVFRSSRNANLAQRAEVQANPQKELWRGVLVNLLNPHPYLFWATVGGPAVVTASRISPRVALVFLLSFYGLLVGSKMALAWLISRRSGQLSMIWYRRVLAGSGIVLVLMGSWLIWQMWGGG